ncbi:hypothetical protein AB0M46_16710 [Dactylosporangium sp. NPDC051485]|uniref:hypothetical protein n=1 Tax=Dactylosporangium sp. NPDC051485 TaxID=3154846 RepID=UPI003434A729
MVMGTAREAIRVVTVAAAAGVAAGGALGILGPSFAEAGPPAPAPARAAPVIVTSLDLLGGRRLEVSLRFTNTGRAVAHLDPAAITVTADGAELPGLASPGSRVVDLPPGASVDETVAFAAPPASAALAVTLPDGQRLPLVR